MTPSTERTTMDAVGGWILGTYAGVVLVLVGVGPWLKEQRWWPWRRNRKVGG